jgi:hypothetical protein
MKFEGKKFFKASIELDNNQFYDCIFDSCVLVYRGGPSPNLAKCSFKNTFFSFAEAAANTLFLLANMYHRGFKDNIEMAFNNIAGNVNEEEKEITFN